MVKREIEIDGRMVTFKASAALPRIYRAKFHRDIFKDLVQLGHAINRAKPGDVPINDLEMFENVAYIMAKFADPSQPETPEAWLDQFDTLSIYEVLPQILDLWNLNVHTDVEAKKKVNQLLVK